MMNLNRSGKNITLDYHSKLHRRRKIFNIWGGKPSAAGFNTWGGGGGVLPKVHTHMRAHAHVCDTCVKYSYIHTCMHAHACMHACMHMQHRAPGVLGSEENGFLFSGSWGALVIIFRDLGSKLIVLGI